MLTILVKERFSNSDSVNRLGDRKCDENLFKRTSNDNKIGTSVEDRMFMDIMDKELVIGEDGKLVAPLPFRQQKLPLPNNYEIALKHALALDANLKKDPRKRDHFSTTTMLKKRPRNSQHKSSGFFHSSEFITLKNLTYSGVYLTLLQRSKGPL